MRKFLALQSLTLEVILRHALVIGSVPAYLVSFFIYMLICFFAHMLSRFFAFLLSGLQSTKTIALADYVPWRHVPPQGVCFSLGQPRVGGSSGTIFQPTLGLRLFDGLEMWAGR